MLCGLSGACFRSLRSYKILNSRNNKRKMASQAQQGMEAESEKLIPEATS